MTVEQHSRGPCVLTIGHGARPAEAFLAALGRAGVTVLVDVRRFPGSRRHPQFGQEPLSASLAMAGIGYQWQGQALGGRRKRADTSRHTALRQPALVGYADHMDTAEFRAAVDALVAQAHAEHPAIMCAETLWWHCHRMLIADALTLRGATVIHLLQLDRRQPHRLSPTARQGGDGWPVYDVPDTLPGLG